LIPVIWTLDDVQMRGIDESKTMESLNDNVRSGVLSNILGIAGIMLAFDFIKTLVLEYETNSGLATDDWIIIFMTIFFVIMTIVFGGGTSYLIGIVYLQKYHMNIVNQLRSKIAKVIPVGVASVRIALQEEINMIQNVSNKNFK
jgi:hypothetical protein